jgi:hypothetical protein
MKMEHTVRAPVAGLLRSFCVAVGDQVGMAQQLMAFEPDAPAPALAGRAATDGGGLG